ncbi:MAG: hypothetical protein QOF82_2272 [Frankiales bacterium]|jgi:hypothetical protein|nr:hypothetical protein [Frankiales bacterium]
MATRRAVRTGWVVAVPVFVLVALLGWNAGPSGPVASAGPPSGALGWPFQGVTSVAVEHQADAERSFSSAVRDYVLQARSHGAPLFQVGRPHPLFAAHYLARPLDVLVLVAPVTGGGRVVGLAGLYGQDRSHHGTDAVVPFSAIDQEVSGNVVSYVRGDVDQVTVVVGGPRAGGLLVNDDGSRQNVNDLIDNQTSFDHRGITWMYASVPATPEHPQDSVITLTDGNGNLSNVLYYGPIGAGEITG